VDKTGPVTAQPVGAKLAAAEPVVTEALVHGAGRRTWWAIAGLAAIAVIALALYTWALSRNGMGNSYYAAAIKSGALSWKAFFFGSLDPGSFITVDKLPAGLWIPALFARVFGFSSWSMLLPQAFAGVASVLIVYRLVRLWAGDVAALLSALAFALTPVAVVIFRLNDPDALLTLLLLLAAWAIWSAIGSGATWKLAAAGALVGAAFLTKMLEAFVVLPALGLVYLLCGPRRLRRRALQLGVALVALVVSGGWWVAIVEFWPAATRPYVGGSTNDSVLNLVFSRSGGYLGNAGPVPNFSGSPGWLRMFNAELGGEISWLVPLALVGLAAGLWVTRGAPRTDRTRAGYMLWGLWSLVIIAVFSSARGVLHPYYTVLLAPGIAALAGAGSVELWRLSRSRRWLSWLLPAAVAGTAWWSDALLKRIPGYVPGLATAVIAVGAVATAALVLVLARMVERRVVVCAVTAVGVAAVLAGPFAYDLSTVGRGLTGPLASAGPAVGAFTPGIPGGPGGVGLPRGSVSENLAVDRSLIGYLEDHREGAKYLIAVEGSSVAVPFILAVGQPVMAMGGFSGSDPAPTVVELQGMVAAGQIHYVLLGGVGSPFAGPPVGGRPPPGADAPVAGSGASPPSPQQLGAPGVGGSLIRVAQWVAARGTVVPPADYGSMSVAGTLYYLP
jgi:4-amino-4-deoxy-L-arabinose transferase-like glycosyltransferase